MSDPWKIALVAALLAAIIAGGILVFINQVLAPKRDSAIRLLIFVVTTALAAGIAVYLWEIQIQPVP